MNWVVIELERLLKKKLKPYQDRALKMAIAAVKREAEIDAALRVLIKPLVDEGTESHVREYHTNYDDEV